MSQPGARSDDGTILRRLKGGDPRALEDLLDRYWDIVLAYVTRLTGSRDAAEDVAQDVFVRLWERRARWKPEGSVRSLLLRLARNEAVSRHRSEEARRRAMAGSEAEARAAAPTPAHELERRGLADALEEAVATLPDRRREVFVLRALHELPYREVAEVMGISVQTVANQYSRALADLRALLEPEEWA